MEKTQELIYFLNGIINKKDIPRNLEILKNKIVSNQKRLSDLQKSIIGIENEIIGLNRSIDDFIEILWESAENKQIFIDEGKKVK